MYYLHQFVESQPDLNLRNEKVLEEMETILRFWLDLGVDGFRVDAACHLVESNQFTNEPLRDPDKEPIFYDDYHHTETADQPESYQLIRRWRHFFDHYSMKHHRDYILFVTEVRFTEKVKKILMVFVEGLQ